MEAEELETEIRKVWAIADVNGDGAVDAAELAELMRQLNKGVAPSALEVAQMFQMITSQSRVRCRRGACAAVAVAMQQRQRRRVRRADVFVSAVPDGGHSLGGVPRRHAELAVARLDLWL
jgi:hypothetical protein